jgi:glutamate dehydrogenase (NAD(P)+)
VNETIGDLDETVSDTVLEVEETLTDMIPALDRPDRDDLGPAKVVYVTERSTGLRGTVVIDNVAAGPAIGGVRMAPDVTPRECFVLARAMTLKNAAAGLRHGGAKSVIRADPTMPSDDYELLVRAFAGAISDLTEYIPGPDMGTNETAMAWVYDEIGRVVGLPAELGGIPLDEIGATGHGLAAAIDVAAPFCQLGLEGARVAVQGFGAVGQHAARFLAKRGCVLVAAADSVGTIADPAGLDLEALVDLKDDGLSVVDHSVGTRLDRDAVVGIECDIWIPAARPDIITVDNVGELRTRIVAQGANAPVTDTAEQVLAERGIVSLPDFIVNAGGVICGAVEYAGGTKTQAFETITERISANTAAILDDVARTGRTPRAAAMDLAEHRVRRAMALRRWS